MKFKKKVLENGLTIIHEKRDVPVTTVMIAVRYGALYEDESEKGIAHFIEHMTFKGTGKRNSQEIAESIEKVGGDINAFTSEEVTAYHVKLSSEYLGLAMDVLFDVFFNASFPKEEFLKERNVICEEIKMYKDNPHSHVMDKIKTMLYEKPFGIFIGGTEGHVRAITYENLVKKYREIYVPKNTIVCVVGNNSFSDVERFVKKYCVERRGGDFGAPEIKKKILREEESRPGVEQENLAIGFHFPKFTERERYAAEIFSAILGEGMSSKLFSEVREKLGLAYVIKTELDLGKNYGYVVIFAGVEKGKSKEVIDICIKEFSKIGDVSEKEIEDAKVQVIGGQDVESEDSSSTAMSLVVEEICEAAENHYKFSEKVKEVTINDLKKLAEKTEFASFVLKGK